MLIPLKHPNKKAILIATGPSLTKEVILTVKKYRNKFVIFGCNDSYTMVPFLDEHYACDDNWWMLRGEEFRRRFPLLDAWSQCPNPDIRRRFNLRFTPGKFEKGLSLNPSLIHYGDNSGYQLLNLALLMGCSQFYLVGYNMQVVEGNSHFFGEHPKGLIKKSPYAKFIESYNTIQPHIKERITNCTTNSALTMFNYLDLEEALSA